MKKGHRTNGEMWINIRRSYGGFTRGSYFNENLTVGELVDEAIREVMREEGFQNFPVDWYLEVQSHRRALDPDSQQMIKELFNGAETIHVKVFDQHARQLKHDGYGWDLH